MGILDRFKPDPTCPHGKPLQVSCPHCTQPQRNRAIDRAKNGTDPRSRTSGQYRTGVTGRTSKTGRHAK